MASLYELTGKYMEIRQILEDADVSDEEIAAILDSSDTNEAFEQKAENYCKIMKNIESDIAGMELEAKRLYARKKTMENRIKGLKERLMYSMEATGKTKITTELFTISVQKNGGQKPLDIIVPVDALPEEMRVKQPDLADKDAIRAYTEANGKVDEDTGDIVSEYGIIHQTGKSLRIR